MYRFLKRGFVPRTTFNTIEKCLVQEGKLLKNGIRCVVTQISKSDSLFPEREDFPSRHIGPRDQDIVTMLDLLGYKVCYP